MCIFPKERVADCQRDLGSKRVKTHYFRRVQKDHLKRKKKKKHHLFPTFSIIAKSKKLYFFLKEQTQALFKNGQEMACQQEIK